MYAIYACIGVVLGVNVGIYGIHGVSGYIRSKRYSTPTKVNDQAAPSAAVSFLLVSEGGFYNDRLNFLDG